MMENHYWAFQNNHKRLFWKGISSSERHKTINELESTINRYGYITDFKMFSDLEISLIIEVEESKIESLYHALEQQISMQNSGKVGGDSSEMRIILINITFSKGTGNLENIIPAVPG